MNSQTIITAPSFTLSTVSAQAQKKAALSLAILVMGGLMLVLLAAAWMPTLAMIDVVLTAGLVATVVTGAPAKTSAISAMKALFVLAMVGGYALVGSVLYALYTF